MELITQKTPAQLALVRQEVEEAEQRLGMNQTALDYLKKRNISEETRHGFHLGLDETERWLVIPYYDVTNSYPLHYKRRAVCGQEPKYLATAGEKPVMFNTIATRRSDIVHITEGEIDAMSLAQCGGNAVGIPGVAFVGPVQKALLEGANGLIVWTDPDEAGRGMLAALKELGLGAVTISADQDLDVNDILVQEGEIMLEMMIAEQEHRMERLLSE